MSNSNIKEITMPFIGMFDLDVIYQTSDVELLYQILSKVNEIVQSQNIIIDNFEKILDWAQNQIETYTKEQLQKWLDDGTLENLILSLGKIVKYYDTTSEMLQSDNLVDGLIIITKGYNNIGDKGGSRFIVTSNTLSLYKIGMVNNLNIYVNDILTPYKLGAVSGDTTQIFNDLISYLKTNNGNLYLDDNAQYDITSLEIDLQYANYKPCYIYGNNATFNVINKVNNAISIKCWQYSQINDLNINGNNICNNVLYCDTTPATSFNECFFYGGINNVVYTSTPSYHVIFNNCTIGSAVDYEESEYICNVGLNINTTDTEINLLQIINCKTSLILKGTNSHINQVHAFNNYNGFESDDNLFCELEYLQTFNDITIDNIPNGFKTPSNNNSIYNNIRYLNVYSNGGCVFYFTDSNPLGMIVGNSYFNCVNNSTTSFSNRSLKVIASCFNKGNNLIRTQFKDTLEYTTKTFLIPNNDINFKYLKRKISNNVVRVSLLGFTSVSNLTNKIFTIDNTLATPISNTGIVYDNNGNKIGRYNVLSSSIVIVFDSSSNINANIYIDVMVTEEFVNNLIII